jgi:hypothetical protein
MDRSKRTYLRFAGAGSGSGSSNGRDWECKGCGYSNYSSRDTCRQCKLTPSKVNGDRGGDLHSWNCRNCTKENRGFQSSCGQCRAQRASKFLNVGNWDCPQCNTTNIERKWACVGCKLPRQTEEQKDVRAADQVNGKSRRGGGNGRQGNFDSLLGATKYMVTNKTREKIKAPMRHLEEKEDGEILTEDRRVRRVRGSSGDRGASQTRRRGSPENESSSGSSRGGAFSHSSYRASGPQTERQPKKIPTPPAPPPPPLLLPLLPLPGIASPLLGISPAAASVFRPRTSRAEELRKSSDEEEDPAHAALRRDVEERDRALTVWIKDVVNEPNFLEHLQVKMDKRRKMLGRLTELKADDEKRKKSPKQDRSESDRETPRTKRLEDPLRCVRRRRRSTLSPELGAREDRRRSKEKKDVEAGKARPRGGGNDDKPTNENPNMVELGEPKKVNPSTSRLMIGERKKRTHDDSAVDKQKFMAAIDWKRLKEENDIIDWKKLKVQNEQKKSADDASQADTRNRLIALAGGNAESPVAGPSSGRRVDRVGEVEEIVLLSDDDDEEEEAISDANTFLARHGIRMGRIRDRKAVRNVPEEIVLSDEQENDEEKEERDEEVECLENDNNKKGGNDHDTAEEEDFVLSLDAPDIEEGMAAEMAEEI